MTDVLLSLKEAIENGETDKVRQMLDRMGNDAARRIVNDKGGDEHGYTALHVAAQANRSKIIPILVKNGADVLAKGGEDEVTPLHYAASHGNLEAVVALIVDAGHKKQQMLDARTGIGSHDTAAHLAARAGKVHVFKALKDAGANMDIKNAAGKTVSEQVQADLKEARQQVMVMEYFQGLLGGEKNFAERIKGAGEASPSARLHG